MDKNFIISDIGVKFPYAGIHGLKIVHISDLHNALYGEGNTALAAAIDGENPDIIVFSGDMIDRVPDEPPAFLQLAENITSACPKYMCTGNHEAAFKKDHPKEFADIIKRLGALGITYLDDACETVNINGSEINIYGIATASSGYSSSLKSIKKRIGECRRDMFNIVLSHDPSWFDALAAWGADMVFSGHVHGGIVNLPLLGGMLSPGCRIMPKYDAGLFAYNDRAKMYLSRGLGGRLDRFRYRNPREIAAVHINDPCGPEEKIKKRLTSDIKFSFKILLSFIMLLTTVFSFMPVMLGCADTDIAVNIILGLLGIFCIYPPAFIANSRLFRLKELFFAFRVLVIAGYMAFTLFFIL